MRQSVSTEAKQEVQAPPSPRATPVLYPLYSIAVLGSRWCSIGVSLGHLTRRVRESFPFTPHPIGTRRQRVFLLDGGWSKKEVLEVASGS